MCVCACVLQDTAYSLHQLGLMVFLPTIAMIGAACLEKPPKYAEYPYFILSTTIILGLFNILKTRIHLRVMWRLEKELCARHDHALRQLSALVPSEAACDHLIAQSVIERLGTSDRQPHVTWVEPSVKVLPRLPPRYRASETLTLPRSRALPLPPPPSPIPATCWTCTQCEGLHAYGRERKLWDRASGACGG